jgi:hypothetical protein
MGSHLHLPEEDWLTQPRQTSEMFGHADNEVEYLAEVAIDHTLLQVTAVVDSYDLEPKLLR